MYSCFFFFPPPPFFPPLFFLLPNALVPSRQTRVGMEMTPTGVLQRAPGVVQKPVQ